MSTTFRENRNAISAARLSRKDDSWLLCPVKKKIAKE